MKRLIVMSLLALAACAEQPPAQQPAGDAKQPNPEVTQSPTSGN